MNRKKIRKILLILLAVLFVIFILLSLFKKKEELPTYGEYTQEDINIIQKEVEEYYSDKITPIGMSRLYGQYNGMNELNDLYRKLNLFVKYLPKVAKISSEEEAYKYYNSNTEDIKDNLGIMTLDEFITFTNYLNSVNYNGEKYISSIIEEDTYKYSRGYLTFDLSFSFENFDNEFKLKVHFANSSTVEPIVFYTIIDDKINDNKDKVIENNTVEDTIIENNTDEIQN